MFLIGLAFAAAFAFPVCRIFDGAFSIGDVDWLSGFRHRISARRK
jgi:hypothetical protein